MRERVNSGNDVYFANRKRIEQGSELNPLTDTGSGATDLMAELYRARRPSEKDGDSRHGIH